MIGQSRRISAMLSSAFSLSTSAQPRTRASGGAVETGKMLTQLGAVDEVVDASQEVIGRDVLLEPELIELASVMGLRESIPKLRLAAGYLLPSVIGAQAAT
jgi:hypothetical protein